MGLIGKRTEDTLRKTIIALTTTILLAGAAGAAEPAALAPLSFLVGEWVGTGAGQPGAAAGSAVFSRDLQDGVIIRRSFAEYPAAADRPVSRHDDLMVIHADADGAVRADYYDNEGHVIRYAVTVPAAGQAEFLSEPAAGQPRFRLSYVLRDGGTLDGAFAIAPPNAPEGPGAFRPYLSWSSVKAGGAAR